MKVTEKKAGEGLVRLEVLASPAEVVNAFAMAQRGFAQQMGVQVRNGQDVALAVEQQLGVKNLDSLVAKEAVDYLVPFAIDKQNIVPALPPQAEYQHMIERGKPFEFQVTVKVKPEFELSSYDPVTIVVPPFEVPEDAVSEELMKLALSVAQFETADPHPIEVGDTCLLALEASSQGERLENLSTDGRIYTTGIGLMPPAFEEQLLGMAPGDTKTFTFDAPKASEDEEAMSLTCTVTIKELQERIVPEINDEWVKQNLPQFSNVEGLRAHIREDLLKEARPRYEAMKIQMAAMEVAKRFNGDIDLDIIEAMRKSMLENLMAQVTAQGIRFEDYVQNQGGMDRFAAMLEMQARQTMVQGYALDAVYRHENMRLTNYDIELSCRSMNPQNPEAARKNLENNGRGFALREAAERMKANRWLAQNAIIEEIDLRKPAGEGKEAPEAEA